ncbi:MAG: 3-hydroxyacyl-CoA dehydrogenase [Proteobacteria bacterium]|nr:3-hydroxyacyl-CoA dehydrogenase [Pseudomonadota bacterium]
MVAITDVVSLEKQEEIAILAVDNPPVNALSYDVRMGLAKGIMAASEDDAVKAVVIICRGRTFIAGADIREFGQPARKPAPPNMFEVTDACHKPLIAAIHGTAFGGGLELAMGCHFRVAIPSAKFGLPEVKIGLLPGAGGTQRLPRIVGPEKALQMITSGNPIGSKEALVDGLIAEIVEGDLESDAIAFAKKVLAENRPLVKVGDMSEKIDAARSQPDLFANFRKANARKFRGFDAPEACIQAVEASVNKPFEEGMLFERELFAKLVSGAQSAAQRYYFFAERQARKLPDIPKETPLIDVQTVAVLGAGTMGGGIAMNFVNIGLPVTLIETTAELLERGLGVIRRNYGVTVSKGKLTTEEVEKRMALITGSTDLEEVAEVDLVVEAVYENMDLKKEIFAKLDKICKNGAILATNSSALNIDEIASVTKRPESVVGLHFFSPANVMKLLEIVRADHTSKSVLATSMDLAKKIGKVAAVVGVCPGFAGNRMFAQRGREVQNILLEGATIAQLDKALFDFGFPMGPFVLSDLIGLDVGWNKETSTSSTIREILCEQGRLGQKSGAGYYKYEQNSRVPIPDPDVDGMIEGFAKGKGYTKREVSDEEIIQRCIYPVINEGAKILEEGIAVRPSDLDVIWVNGYGWPMYLGGPMFYGDQVGLDKVLETMKKFQKEYGDIWKPAPLLEKLVSEGKGFKDLS